MMDFDRFDVVDVPFPFTATAAAARTRPALVLSGRAFHETNQVAVLAAIVNRTGDGWPSDIALRAPEPAGVRAPARVRFRVFSLETALVRARRGRLDDADRSAVERAWLACLGLWSD